MKIYIGNLNPNTDDAGLHQAFAAHGEVSTAAVVRDRTTQASRGFGFVEMPVSPEGQAAIIAVNGSVLDGNSIVVSEARAHGVAPHAAKAGPSSR